jgi:hypothetical protein
MLNLMHYFKKPALIASQTANRPELTDLLLDDYFDPDKEAIVTQAISPGKPGQIKFQGSWWTARCRQPLTFLPGEIVYVIEPKRMPLYIEPAPLAIPVNSTRTMPQGVMRSVISSLPQPA